jgi:hypothetical protein
LAEDDRRRNEVGARGGVVHLNGVGGQRSHIPIEGEHQRGNRHGGIAARWRIGVPLVVPASRYIIGDQAGRDRRDADGLICVDSAEAEPVFRAGGEARDRKAGLAATDGGGEIDVVVSVRALFEDVAGGRGGRGLPGEIDCGVRGGGIERGRQIGGRGGAAGEAVAGELAEHRAIGATDRAVAGGVAVDEIRAGVAEIVLVDRLVRAIRAARNRAIEIEVAVEGEFDQNILLAQRFVGPADGPFRGSSRQI